MTPQNPKIKGLLDPPKKVDLLALYQDRIDYYLMKINEEIEKQSQAIDGKPANVTIKIEDNDTRNTTRNQNKRQL